MGKRKDDQILTFPQDLVCGIGITSFLHPLIQTKEKMTKEVIEGED